MRSGVYIHRNQGFRLLDHHLSPGGQGHAPLEGLFDLSFDIEPFKDGDGVLEQIDLSQGSF